MRSTENTLIARVIADGNARAFEGLVKMHQSRIRSYLLRLTRGDASLTDDLAQEVFLMAYRKIKLYRGDGSFSGWLHKIAYRSFLQGRRQSQARQARESAWQGVQVAPRDMKDVKLDIEKALATLKGKERSALTLCFSHGYSHEEACGIMGLPLGTLKSHIARGKANLAYELRHLKKDWS